RERPAPLRHVGDPQPDDVLGRPAGDLLRVEADLARRPDHAAHGAQTRRLAGTLGPEDPRDPAVLDGETDPVQDLRPAVLRLDARARAGSTRLSVPNGRPAAGWWAIAPRSRNSRSSAARVWIRSSSRPTHGSRSAFEKKSLRVLLWTPTMTFCSTVIVGKSA